MKTLLSFTLTLFISITFYAGNWCSNGYVYLNGDLIKPYDYAQLHEIADDINSLELYVGDTLVVCHSNYYMTSHFIGKENGSDSLINAELSGQCVIFFGNGNFNMRTVNGCMNIHLELELEFQEIIEEVITTKPVIGNSDLFYPNPVSSSESLFFDTNYEFGGNLHIYGLNGKLIQSMQFFKGRNQVDIRNLDMGIYFVVFEYFDKIEKRKLVIQ